MNFPLNSWLKKSLTKKCGVVREKIANSRANQNFSLKFTKKDVPSKNENEVVSLQKKTSVRWIFQELKLVKRLEKDFSELFLLQELVTFKW